MPYSALGLTGGSPVDRLQASFLRRAAQRMGPAARCARAAVHPQALSTRERMEARHARMGDRKRRERAFDEQLEHDREQHELAMRLGEDRLAGAEHGRNVADRRLDELVRRGDLGQDRETRLRDAITRQLELQERGQDFAHGLQHALATRSQTELERNNLARERIDASKAGGVADPERILLHSSRRRRNRTARIPFP